MKKIVIVSTIDITIQCFLLNHIQKLIKEGFQIFIITNIKNNFLMKNLNIRLINLDFHRNISPLADLFCFVRLFFILKKISPDLVLSISPKAGLLTSIVSFLLKIRLRIHIFTGQVWANKNGLFKNLLKFFDKTIINFSTHVILDSYSQKKFLFRNNLFNNKKKCFVIESGSICGVDTNKFSRSYTNRLLLRKKLNIDNNSVIIIFVGRINYEKGVQNLISTFEKIYLFKKNIFLLLVGHDEINLKKNFLKKKYFNNIKIFNHSQKIENFFQASDIYCLPSEREGFGVSVIEASSCQLPVVCSDIYGLKDSSIHNFTGLKFKLGQNHELEKSLIKLIEDKKLRQKYGKQGRQWVKKNFEKNKVINGYINFIKKLLSQNSIYK